MKDLPTPPQLCDGRAYRDGSGDYVCAKCNRVVDRPDEAHEAPNGEVPISGAAALKKMREKLGNPNRDPFLGPFALRPDPSVAQVEVGIAFVERVPVPLGDLAEANRLLRKCVQRFATFAGEDPIIARIERHLSRTGEAPCD